MLGLFVQLALSWLLAWLYERSNLRVLGLWPTQKRWKDFVLFFVVTALCCASGFVLKMYLAGHRWQLNPMLSPGLIAAGVWWNIKSVLFEELIFRGVLFYILIKKAGAKKAMLFSAISFGIYHWFSFNVFGNVVQMVFVFLLTGIMGWVYAYGYAKTMSLYIPIAMHLGWNLTQGFVFSEGSIGTGILQQVGNQPFRTDSYLLFLLVFLFPLLSVWAVTIYLLKNKRQADPNMYTPKQKLPFTLKRF